MNTSGARYQQWLSVATATNLPVYSDSMIELTRQVWDRNAEQFRQIYKFYANTLEIRRLGSGPMRLLLSADRCKEFLQDFQVIPHIIDVGVSANSYCNFFKKILKS